MSYTDRITYGSDKHVITLSTDVADFTEVLRNLTYFAVFEDLRTEVTRSVVLTIGDGDVNLTGSISVRLASVNDTAIADLNGAAAGVNFSATFVERGDATSLANTGAAELRDVDSDTINGIQITLEGEQVDGSVECVSVDIDGNTTMKTTKCQCRTL